MEQNLLEKTGETLDQWKRLLTQQAFSKHGEYMAFLKKQHGISHGFANFITLKFREADAGSSDADDLIVNQYKNKKTSNQFSKNYTRPSQTLEQMSKLPQKNQQ